MTYRDYIKLNSIREATGWKNWVDRKESLIFEIKLINYAINTAKNNVAKIDHDEKNCNNILTCINKMINKNLEKFMDNIYLIYRESKPQYSFDKRRVQPAIDPKLLDVGNIMYGYVNRRMTFSKKMENEKIM